MTTMKAARRIALLLSAQDQLGEWLSTIGEEAKQDYICFSEIDARSAIDASAAAGWTGELTIPRDIAIRMLGHEIEAIQAELASLGVTEHVEEGDC